MIWHSSSAEDVLLELNTDPDEGLFSDEADDRIAACGKNRLAGREKKSIVRRFFEQLSDFTVIILFIAAAISLGMNFLTDQKDWGEPVVILAIVILNAVLGVVQEAKAEAALDALKSTAAPGAKLRRDRVVKTVPSEEIVPGDILLLEAGDYIPADARLIECFNLHCDESALTGESIPIEKRADALLEDITPVADRINMVYSGCTVTAGRATAVVTATGMNTEIGRIATMIDSTEDSETPLKARLRDLGKILGILALAICGVIFLIGILEAFFSADRANITGRVIELFMTAVSLAVAAIPESLPAIVTVVLALGVRKMVKKNAIVRRLPAVETLGSASVICSDKTGTLTQNRMTAVRLYDGKNLLTLGEDEISPDAVRLLTYGALCCDATVRVERDREIPIGDPTEVGIVSAALAYTHRTKEEIDSTCPRLGEIPFSSERKRMTTVHMIDGAVYVIVKGAPDVLLPLCTAEHFGEAAGVNEALAGEALRVLAVGYKKLDEMPVNLLPEELEKDLTFCGLIGMIDPPRREAIEAIRLCKKAGIRPVMITGDQILTATAIARQLGMFEADSLAVTGAELSAMSEEEFAEKLDRIAVYARVTPEDKIRIVEAWKARGETVAMTGDGVNDAPALKAADIGCAMGQNGTDVAKGAADMILTDDNFATIVTAVREGRGIYDNIRKAVHFLLSCNLGEVLTVFFGMLFFRGSPLAAVQLLWINLVTDSAPALALGAEPAEYDVMERKPRDKKESFFAGRLGITAAWQGAMVAALTLIGYAYGAARYPYAAALHGSTCAFTVLSLSQLAHAFNARSLRHPGSVIGWFRNKALWLAVGISLALVLIALFTPLAGLLGLTFLSPRDWAIVIILSCLPLLVGEMVKWIPLAIRKQRKHSAHRD